MPTESCGLASSGPIDNPKVETINTVENGFNINLQGGKPVEGKPYRHSTPYVAKTAEEALFARIFID
jgi:hypothetical protein